jgi:hypothetical protein
MECAISQHFYLIGSLDQTNNGSEISDTDMHICKNRKLSELFEAITSLYKYTNVAGEITT